MSDAMVSHIMTLIKGMDPTDDDCGELFFDMIVCERGTGVEHTVRVHVTGDSVFEQIKFCVYLSGFSNYATSQCEGYNMISSLGSIPMTRDGTTEEITMDFSRFIGMSHRRPVA